MRSALGELVIEGINTNLDFQYDILSDPDFQSGNVDTNFIPSHFPEYTVEEIMWIRQFLCRAIFQTAWHERAGRFSQS